MSNPVVVSGPSNIAGSNVTFSGPAALATNAACCKLGPALAINVEMKTGEKERVLFTDSCFGYDCIFTGRDHESAQYVYVKFTDVATIDFP